MGWDWASGAGTEFGVGIASGGGIAYYLEPKIAIYTVGDLCPLL